MGQCRINGDMYISPKVKSFFFFLLKTSLIQLASSNPVMPFVTTNCFLAFGCRPDRAQSGQIRPNQL